LDDYYFLDDYFYGFYVLVCYLDLIIGCFDMILVCNCGYDLSPI